MQKAALLCLAMSGALSQAQESGKLEKLEVVGSRIKRIDMEGPQSIEIIDRDKIDRSGSTSVADLLRDNSVATNFGGYRSEVNLGSSPAAGANSINLRGLGEKNTLILLNGQRLPSNGISGAVDVNTIPISAVDRVEVLKDGASAIYGSDAAGGVINIVTKSEFEGWNISGRHEMPTAKGGAISNGSVMHGLSTERWTVLNVLSKRKAEPIYLRDRSWTEQGQSTFSVPGNYRDDGASAWHDYNTTPDLCQTSLTADGQCTYDYSETSQYYPKIEELSFLNSTEFDLSDNVSLFSRILASRNIDLHNMAPNAALFRVPASVADTLNLPSHTNGNDILVKYRAVGLGTRDTRAEARNYDILAGAKGSLSNGWDWVASMSSGEYKVNTRLTGGYALVDRINELIASGDFTPFSLAGSSGIQGAAYEPWQTTTTRVQRFESSISGETFELPGGVAALSTGVSYTAETYKSQSDFLSTQYDTTALDGKVLGNRSSEGSGDRKSYAGYIELSMPILETVELQAATRYDSYSDFGAALSPKLALKWNAYEGLLFRSNFGTGFRAPSLRQLFQSETQSSPFITDKKRCDATGLSCSPTQYTSFTGGNRNLEEEKSQSYGAGFVLQATETIELTADLWETKIENAIPSSWDFDEVARADALDILGDTVTINRNNNDPTGEILSIRAPLQNVSSKYIRGADINLKLTFGNAANRVLLDGSYARIIFYKEEALPGLGEIERVGTNGYPGWRSNVNITYIGHDFEVNLRNLQIGKHEKNIADQGDVGSFSRWDAQLKYAYTDNGSVMLGSNNAFATRPPLDDSRDGSGQLINSLYSAIGRTYYLGFSQYL